MNLKRMLILGIVFICFISLILFIVFFSKDEKKILDDLEFLELEDNISFKNYEVSDPYFYCYYDIKKCETKYNNYNYDKKNIPIVKINGEDTYNPTSISQNGLFAYSLYKTNNDKKKLDHAIYVLDYLISMIDDETGILNYNFDFKVGGTEETLIAPWGSSMAQGQFLSLLSRIYLETKDKSYLKYGKKAIEPLNINVENGGFLTQFKGRNFYEEYPTKTPNYTLNGFMFTLMGLYDFCEATDYKLSCSLYEDGLKTLEYILPYFDYGNISLYHLAYMDNENLKPHYSEKYHNIHIRQLILFDELENKRVFKKYIKKWKGYLKYD